jgi:hypothetical protein
MYAGGEWDGWNGGEYGRACAAGRRLGVRAATARRGELLASGEAPKVKFVPAGAGRGKLTTQHGSTAESPVARVFEVARLQQACALLMPGMRHSPRPRASAAPPRSVQTSAAVINPDVSRFNIFDARLLPEALLGQAPS